MENLIWLAVPAVFFLVAWIIEKRYLYKGEEVEDLREYFTPVDDLLDTEDLKVKAN